MDRFLNISQEWVPRSGFPVLGSGFPVSSFQSNPQDEGTLQKPIAIPMMIGSRQGEAQNRSTGANRTITATMLIQGSA